MLPSKNRTISLNGIAKIVNFSKIQDLLSFLLIYLGRFYKNSGMKRILNILAVASVAFSFSACDLLEDQNRDTDKEIIIPDDKPKDDNSGDDNNNGDNTGDNGGNTGDNGGNEGGNDGNEGGNDDTTGDRSKYEQYNHTFTQADAIYFGAYYEGQPSDVSNWWIELADNNFSLEDYSGEGYNVILEFFSKGTAPAAGTYTIDAFDKNPFSHLSLLYGYVDEYQEDGQTVEYPAGTWLFKGADALAGATAGSMTIAVSGSKYTISYTLHDDDFEITFKGNYSGELPIYDGTQTSSAAAPQKVAKIHRDLGPVKPVRLLRVKK